MSQHIPVSVVIPAYNAGRFIEATISSVFAQTVEVDEVIVVDDGSADNTVAIARRCGVRVIEQKNSGVSVARNTGIEQARNPWIALLDADDLWSPDKLARQWSAINVASNVSFAFCDFAQFDEFGERNASVLHEVHRQFASVLLTSIGDDAYVCDSRTLTEALLVQNVVQPSALFILKEVVLALGGFDLKLLACQDYDFVMRLMREHVGAYIDRSLVRYRRHSGATTSNIPKSREGLANVALRAIARPFAYSPLTVAHFKHILPSLLIKCGFAHLRYGDLRRARTWFGRSLSERFSWTAATLYLSTFAFESRFGLEIRSDAVRLISRAGEIFRAVARVMPATAKSNISRLEEEPSKLKLASAKAATALKVAFIVEKFPLISETFILDEIVGLIDRGIDITIYAFKRGNAADVHPAYKTHHLSERIVYCVPPETGRIARLVAAVPATFEFLVRNPAAFVRCVLSRKRGVQTRTFVSLARSFVNSRIRFDIVHAHFGPNGVRAEVLRRAGAFHAPIITTFHGYDVSSFVTERGVSVYHDLALLGDRFIAVSKSIAVELLKIGFVPERIDIMPLGVDSKSFAPAELDRSSDVIRIISIGRFVEKKGFAYGIRAVVDAHRSNPAISYDIIGDGELRAELDGLISQLGAGAFIKLHGFKDQSEIRTFLSQSDILLLPSVTASSGDHEGMPIVAKEAMAAGLAVVGSWHGGIPEVVADGYTGLLSAERDVADLARHLLALSSDKRRRKEFGAAGRALILSDYDNARLIDDLIALYRRVVVSSSFGGRSE